MSRRRIDVGHQLVEVGLHILYAGFQHIDFMCRLGIMMDMMEIPGFLLFCLGAWLFFDGIERLLGPTKNRRRW